MKIKKTALASGVISCMFILLIRPQASLRGAGDGLLLWYRTLFPTLMPFMVLSNFIVLTGCAKPIGRLLSPLTRLLRLPVQAGYCILVGLLCGYPMGAYVCAGLNVIGEINDADTEYLAPVCNNVSPMFMISYIALGCLGDSKYILSVMLSLIGGSVLGMFLLRIMIPAGIHTAGIHTTKKRTAPKIEAAISPKPSISVSAALNQSIENALMASLKLCIYVMLFSVAGSLINELDFLNDITKAGLVSLCEITAGLNKLALLDIPIRIKFLLMMVFTAFGGFSSVFQTMSLSSGAHFNTGKYIAYKIVTALTTALIVLFVEAVGI